MKKLKVFWRATRKYIFIVTVGILLYELLENFGAVHTALAKIISVFAPIFAGLMLAFIINIPACAFEGLLRRWGLDSSKKLYKFLCILLSYIIVFGLLILIICVALPKVIESLQLLASNAQSYYNSAADWVVNFWESLDVSGETAQKIIAYINSGLEKLGKTIITQLPKLLNYTFDAVGAIADTFLAITFSIYALACKDKLIAQARRFIRASLPEKASESLLNKCAFANSTYRSYYSGQLVSCSIIGILCYIFMRIFNMPFPEMISLLIAVFALIPILGPWLSTIPSAFIILMASPDNPLLAVWFIVMILVIQQIDNNFVYPRVVGNAVGLSAVWVLFSIIVGGGLFGFVGLLFAVPTTAIIYRFIGDWTNNQARARGIPIVDTVPRKEYNLRGKRVHDAPKHTRCSDKKKKSKNHANVQGEDSEKGKRE